VSAEPLEARIARAKAYPFPRHDHCFLFRDGAAIRLPPDAACDTAGRVPVLAAGSNQSHEQLARKYAGREEFRGTVIPAWRGRLHGFDTVYAAKFTAYGSIPATFQHSPGTAVTVFVQWLTPQQLQRMHETEGGYDYDRLTGIRIALDRGGELTEAFAYSSSTGCLSHDGEHIGIAEIAAQGRRFRSLAQHEILAAMRDRLAPGKPLEAFIVENLDDASLRATRAAELARTAIPLRFPRETLLSFPGSATPSR
jgi:hypothetical protein